MQKKTLALAAAALFIIALTISCKKSSPKAPTGNVPHALSDTFYVRALLDTTWVYQGDENRDECQTNGSVCSEFLIYGPGGSFDGAQFTLTDSAHPAPQDTTILSWAGKTFAAKTDPTSSHAYTFSFTYPDSVGRTMSSDYIVNNAGAKLTITSVVYNGVSQYTFDSITPYKSYIIQGTISCKLTHLNDTVIHTISQGVYSINVIEAKP
jgi:hypothetical protein